jgi:hypothetical protein
MSKPERLIGGFAANPHEQPPDFALCARSLREDTQADKDWFAAHPGTHVRTRPATRLELAAFHLLGPAETVVRELEPGVHLRDVRTPTAPTVMKMAVAHGGPHNAN